MPEIKPKEVLLTNRKETQLLMRLMPDEDGQEYGSGVYFGRILTPQEKIEVQEYLMKATARWMKRRP